MAMRQNGVAAIAFIRSGDHIAARDGNSVMMRRAAFGGQQIIAPVYLVNMRRFCPHRAFDRTIPDNVRLAHKAA